MADSKYSLPEAWKNGELTADTISRRHERLLPDVADLEKDLTAVGKSIEGYIDALNNYCSAGCRVSATFAKLLGDTTLSKISQQFQQVTDKLEHKALNDCNADISSSVLTTLSEFTSLLPAVKQEIGDYKRCNNRHSKCQETLESFAQKDLAASESKRFQQVKERFHLADRDYTQKQEQLSQCLSSLEGNRIKMIGASLLSLLHTIAQFNGDMLTMLAPLGEYQSVGDYLRDREIAPQLKEATTTWCSFAQSYQSIRENDLSGKDVYNLLKHKKGEELSVSQKFNLAKHVKTLLEDYKKDVVSMDDGPVTIPGGFFKNPAGIRVALKGCCSRLESLAIDGVNLCPSHRDMIATLQQEIPKVQLAVASVGKPWHTVANLEGSDIVHSRQHCLKDLIEPLAKQFDIPFTKESFMSFTLTVLNEACSEKTILASKIAVQLLYGKDDLVVVKLSPDSSKTRNVRLHCKEKGVNIEVQLTWWVTSDGSLFSGILEEDNSQPLFEVNTTYSTMVDYMDYLEEKESRLPSITVEYRSCAKQDTQDSTQLQTVTNVPVAPPRSKHYARKYAARKKKSELDSLISRSVNGAVVPNRTKSPQGTASHLSLASETELSEVINFLSGIRPRGSPDDADTESVCSTRALSDSGIESVHNAKLGVAGGKAGGSAEMDDQTKGKKGKKKDKKAATKSESFNKKKKKKRSDRKKEKKKAAAEEQENGGKKEDMNTITEDSQKVKEEIAVKSGQEAVIISESLRSVWEQGDKQQHDTESTPTNTLSLQVPNLANQSSKLYDSQDSIYYSCWSIPAHDADESVTKTTTNQDIVPSEYNGGWSKRYEQQVSQASQRSIWSPALPTSTSTVESFPRKEAWPPSLKRQDGVDVDEGEPNSMVGESVFSLGLEISGFELFPAAKQASSNSSKSIKERSERLDQRNATFQPPMWQTGPRGIQTAGQFSERSSSYGEGLHYLPQHEPMERMRLHTHHSDPFLAKNIPWAHGVPPMYMKVRYNPNLIAPYPGEEVPGGYGPLQSGRGPRGFPKQGQNPVDRRRATSQFYVPPRAGPL